MDMYIENCLSCSDSVLNSSFEKISGLVGNVTVELNISVAKNTNNITDNTTIPSKKSVLV